MTTQFMAVDIGNTNIHIGVFSADRIAASWRINTDPRRTADEYRLMLLDLLRHQGIKPAQIDAAAVCSVSPRATGIISQALASGLGKPPAVLDSASTCGIKFDYDIASVGPDRIADAVAARSIHPESPVVVVDAGTGLVFDAITADGTYLGGAIAPGLELAAAALSSKTALLPAVTMRAPETAIGKDTAHAIQSGLLYGYAELIDGMVRRFRQELSPASPEACRTILTGGYAELVAGLCGGFDTVDEHLTLKGVRLIHEAQQA